MRLVLISCLLALGAHAAPIGSRHAAIIDGDAAAGPAAAVGALLATADDGRSHEGAFMCSAVLVAPTVALTAAHCVALVEADAAEEGWQLDWWLTFADDVRRFDGPDPTLPPRTVAVRQAVVHPGFDAGRPIRSHTLDAAHDLAVLLLAEPAPVAAVPMARTPPEAAPVLIGGYGMRADDPDAPGAAPGLRLAGPSRLFSVGSHELRVGRRLGLGASIPPGLAEKCGGDSGGPTFAETAAGWRVVGLTSRGHADDPGCAIAGIDTRVDVYAVWVDAVRVAADPSLAADPPTCVAAPGHRRPHGIAPALLMLGWLSARRRGRWHPGWRR